MVKSLWYRTIKNVRFCILVLFFGTIWMACIQDRKASTSGEAIPDRTTLAAALADSAEKRQYIEWDLTKAEKAFKEALELDPKLARAHAHYATLLHLVGKKEEALFELKLAMELEPESPLWPAWCGWSFYLDKRFDEGLKYADASLAINPEFPVGLYVKGSILALTGDYKAATTIHKEAGALDSMWRWPLGVTYALAGNIEGAVNIASELAAEQNPWDTWGIAEIYAALDNKDEAFRWLDFALERRHPYFPWLKTNITLENLFEDPRFEELVKVSYRYK